MPSRASVFDRRQAGTYADTSLGTVWTDDSLGALMDHLDAIGELNNTLIVFTMDHGMVSKDTVYEEGVRVALMVRGPGVVPGQTVSLPVTNLDLLPTIMDALGLGDSMLHCCCS